MPGRFEEYDDLDPETDLDVNERSGLVSMPAFIVFADLAEIGQLEDYAAKWQVTFRHPKGSEQAQKLFAVCDLIARKTWGNDADDKLDAIWGCVEKGVAPKNSDISLQDGDLYKPDRNHGHWLVKASRREDEGRPALYDKQGQAIYAPINAVTTLDGEEVEDPDEEEVVGDESAIPVFGDFCMILIRVWAQAKRERLNFSVEGVRFVKKGAGTKAASNAQRDSALKGLAVGALPELPETVDDDYEPQTEKVAKRPSKKAAPKKKASAKKSPKKGVKKKKKGTVFRKQRK